jgi:hypothetical protein
LGAQRRNASEQTGGSAGRDWSDPVGAVAGAIQDPHMLKQATGGCGQQEIFPRTRFGVSMTDTSICR